MAESTTKPKLDKVPDHEDDLDDLDDVLDEFSEKPLPSAPPPTATTSATSGRPRTNTRVDAKPASLPGSGPPLDSTTEVDEDELSSEFAKELARGMESLMREISGAGSQPGGSSSSTGGAGEGSDDLGEDDETTKALKAAWEAMLIEGMNGKTGDELLPSLGEILGDKPGSSSSRSAPAESTTPRSENFQDRIKQAMDKLKESESELRNTSGGAGGAGADASPESIESLLKSLGDLGLGGEENDAEIAGFLESMMSQLMSKEILYEPLKELAESFPPYLANPSQPLSAEDKDRYGKQLACVKRIVEVFERPSYSDSDPESNKAIVRLMSEMQSHGSPPTELMGPLPAGFDGSIPGLDPNNPESCTIA